MKILLKIMMIKSDRKKNKRIKLQFFFFINNLTLKNNNKKNKNQI
jgi:hypothetical protein